MFEKEVEELIEESKRLNTTPRETVCKAIEFGYNKAKEEDKWHYNDYPKNDDLVLCRDFVDYPFLAYYDGENWGNSEYETVTCVASWKYITPPKED